MRENMLKTQQVLLENRCHTDISLTQEGVCVCVHMRVDDRSSGKNLLR